MPQLPIDHRSDPVTVTVASLDERGSNVTQTGHETSPEHIPTSSEREPNPASLPLKVTVKNTFIDFDAEEGGIEGDMEGPPRRLSKVKTMPARFVRQMTEESEKIDKDSDDEEDDEDDDTQKHIGYDSTPYTTRFSDQAINNDEAFMPSQYAKRYTAPASFKGAASQPPQSAPPGGRSILLQIPMQVPGDLDSSSSGVSEDLTATVTNTQVSIEGRCAVVDLRVIIGPNGVTHTPMRSFAPSSNQPVMVNSSLSHSSPPGIFPASVGSADVANAELAATQETTSARSRKKAVKQKAATAKPEDDTKKSSIVCCHWKNKGFCKLDSNCKFMHPADKKGVGAAANKSQVHPGAMGWPMTSNGLNNGPGFPYPQAPMGFPPVMAYPAAAAMAAAAHAQLSLAAALSPHGYCEQ